MIHLGFHIGRKILLVFFFTEFHRFFWHEHSGVEGPGPREKDLLHMQMCHSVCKCAQYANEVAVADWRTRSVEKRKKKRRDGKQFVHLLAEMNRVSFDVT